MLRGCLTLEEYGPEIKYIKGPDNDAADPLIRIPLINSGIKERDSTREHLTEIYCVNQLDGDIFPLTYRTTNKYQRKDKNLVEKLECTN